MVVLLIILVSLSTIYFTRLLFKKNMKIAAVSVAVLYGYIIAWTYAVFILDVADLGFSETETRLSLLHGSDIYHSFVSLTDKMSVIPLEFLKAIVAVAAVILCTSFAVAFHGIFEVTKAIVAAVKEQHSISLSDGLEKVLKPFIVIFVKYNIIKIHCRMNC